MGCCSVTAKRERSLGTDENYSATQPFTDITVYLPLCAWSVLSVVVVGCLQFVSRLSNLTNVSYLTNSRRSSFITVSFIIQNCATRDSIPYASHGRRSHSCATRSIPDHQSRGNAGQIPPILVSCESPSGVVPPRSSSRQRLAVYMGRHERG